MSNFELFVTSLMLSMFQWIRGISQPYKCTTRVYFGIAVTDGSAAIFRVPNDKHISEPVA
jgi:hypothetical protein